VGGKLTLSRLIWAIRQSNEETHTDFAEKSDMSNHQLCDIKHGRKSISPKLAASRVWLGICSLNAKSITGFIKSCNISPANAIP
jgi:hypothetical protein